MQTMDLTAVLPDGRPFDFWERPLSFDAIWHVSAADGSDVTGDGSADRPFATIGREAAECRGLSR